MTAKKTEKKTTTAKAYEGNSNPPKMTGEKRKYYNGVTTLILTEDEFERGGYAMQAFVDRGPVDERIDGVVDDSPKDE
jgi:TolA-binding protein